MSEDARAEAQEVGAKDMGSVEEIEHAHTEGREMRELDSVQGVCEGEDGARGPSSIVQEA